MTDELRANLQRIIDKKHKDAFTPKILLERVIQTIEEYIADNLNAKSRYEKIKAKARIEAYEDCIKLIKEIL